MWKSNDDIFEKLFEVLPNESFSLSYFKILVPTVTSKIYKIRLLSDLEII